MTAETAPKRSYQSPLRQQQAARTRGRIIESAAMLFSLQGFGGTTMGDIAREAEVSIESVHATGSKAYLLIEAFRTRYMGEGGWDSILEQDLTQEIMAIEEVEPALDALEDFLVSAHGRSADLLLQLRSVAAVEPLVAESWDGLRTYKRESFVATARWMVRIGAIEEPVTEAEMPAVAASLNVIMSAETHLQLTRDWGLDEDLYRTTMRHWMRTVRP